jgi:ER lumen protein retaining receptor
MVYNTIFKIVFLAGQAYIVYLMLKDYKPTVDPNADTFRVEYLLGGSAVLAVLLPYKYEIVEVCLLRSWNMLVPVHM